MGRLRAACIVQLCHADHRGDAAAIADWAGDGSAEKFLKLLAQPGMVLLVAERDDVIVGLGARAGQLVTLNYVDPAQRFSGVSKAIMAALERGMVEDGFDSARLNSTITAMQFYDSLGWRRQGEPLPDGSRPMRKTLARPQ